MKIKLMDIILLGGLAVGGYFIYRYITGKKAAAETVAPVVNIFQQTPYKAAEQTVDLLTGAAVSQGAAALGDGFTLPAPMGEEKPAEVTIAEQFIDFAVGITKANPFTAPVVPVISAVLNATEDIVKSSYIKALPPTEMTTPTIPKYTTDYEPEIISSAAPDIVKSKIIAGKIW